jgi:hypothetical protein
MKQPVGTNKKNLNEQGRNIRKLNQKGVVEDRIGQICRNNCTPHSSHSVFQVEMANHQPSLKSSYVIHVKILGSDSAKSSQDRRCAGRTTLTRGNTRQAAAFATSIGHQPIIRQPSSQLRLLLERACHTAAPPKGVPHLLLQRTTSLLGEEETAWWVASMAAL